MTFYVATLLIFLLVFVFGIVVFIFLKKIWGYAYSYFFWGAINVPTTEERVEKMVEILDVKPGHHIVDLGAGDGRLVIAVAKMGAVAYGYEINPFLVSLAKKNIKKVGLEGKAFVYLKNFWWQNLSNFDGVVVYGMSHMMEKLEKKLQKELKPGVKIISNYFAFPKWNCSKKEDNIYLYIKE
jgi:cyclopropane fatty-acyl-phospholipid synthase-like methyltransferase